MNVKKYACVLLCLLLTGCGNTVSDADHLRAQRYYQYLPVCQKISAGAEITDEQLEMLDSAFQLRRENYEQTMYHIVGDNSYMNPIFYLTDEKLVTLRNYSPMASVLYQHKDEIAMNPILLMRQVLEGDNNPETDYDNYTEQIARTVKSEYKEIIQEEWKSPQTIYTSSTEMLIKSMFQTVYPENAENFQVGHTTDSSSKTDMYYVYLIEFHEDIECYAYYFYINDNGAVYQAAMDYLLYGGDELAGCVLPDAAFAGNGYKEEKFEILEKILNIPKEKENVEENNGCELCHSGFSRNYISETDGIIACFEHHDYTLQQKED